MSLRVAATRITCLVLSLRIQLHSLCSFGCGHQNACKNGALTGSKGVLGCLDAPTAVLNAYHRKQMPPTDNSDLMHISVDGGSLGEVEFGQLVVPLELRPALSTLIPGMVSKYDCGGLHGEENFETGAQRFDGYCGRDFQDVRSQETSPSLSRCSQSSLSTELLALNESKKEHSELDTPTPDDKSMVVPFMMDNHRPL